MNYLVDDVILSIQNCSLLVERDNMSTLLPWKGLGVRVEVSNSIGDPIFQHLLLFQRKQLHTSFCVGSF